MYVTQTYKYSSNFEHIRKGSMGIATYKYSPNFEPMVKILQSTKCYYYCNECPCHKCDCETRTITDKKITADNT